MVANAKILLRDKSLQLVEACAANCTFNIDDGSRFLHDVGS